MESTMARVCFMNVLVLLIIGGPKLCSGLTVTLSGVNPNGYVMNQAATVPSVDMICSYELGSDTQPAEYVTFYKDGTDTANQIAVIKVTDGSSVKMGDFQNRADAVITVADPQFTFRLGSLEFSDAGSYSCKVSLNFQSNTVTSSPQSLMVLARPQTIDVSQTLVGPSLYRVECQSNGGRPAAQLMFFTRDASGTETEVNATNAQTDIETGNTFMARASLDQQANMDNPVTVICRASHSTLSTPLSEEIMLPPGAGTTTTSTTASTQKTTTPVSSSGEINLPSCLVLTLAALALLRSVL